MPNCEVLSILQLEFALIALGLVILNNLSDRGGGEDRGNILLRGIWPQQQVLIISRLENIQVYSLPQDEPSQVIRIR